MIKAFGCSAKNLGLLFTLCRDDYLMRFDAGVLWALSELARAPMHFNVQPLSHFSLSLSFPHPPPPLFLYWTSKDRRIMLINSTKTSWKTESEDTGVSTRAFVFEKVCVRVCMSNSVWACSATCASKSGCFFSFLHCFCILQWLCVPPYMDFHSLSIQAGF